MYWLRGLLNLLVLGLALGCGLGFIESVINRLFGTHFGANGTEAPTEWQAILAFFIGTLIFFPLLFLLWKTDNNSPPSRK